VTPDRSERRQLLAALLLIAVALVVVVIVRTSGAPAGPRAMASIFQDDDHLLYASTPVVTRTLDTLESLGVTELRATVLWKVIAPDPGSTAPPAGFRAGDPSAYPAASWAPYDRLVELAQARDIGVDFDITAPGPLWAMARHAPSPRYADHWAPSAQEFGLFTRAVAARYSGHYSPSPGAAPLPRVSFWSIWNEPNQPGWLAPQWAAAPGVSVLESPALYRDYVDAAWNSLLATGHTPARDTILIGELAPEGAEGPPLTYRTATPPLLFLRALYCVDSAYRPLRGAAAAALACPQSGDPASFVSANPALFAATGFGHHPYSFFLPPDVSLPDPNFAPISDLDRLERALDAAFTAYGVHRRIPLWLTEYGYETDPPNPFRGVDPRLQSRYLNEAQYMAFRDPRVRSMAQFLLYDALPDSRYPPGTQAYWSTFQTGLLYADGTPKPSLNSYRVPLFVPDPVLSPRRQVLIWAMLRNAPRGSTQQVFIQWHPQDAPAYRAIGVATVRPPGEVLIDEATLPGPGVVRIAWISPRGTVEYSRGSGVR
jgi:hypothetical protein